MQKQSSHGIGEIVDNNDQLLALYDIMAGLRERVPSHVNIMVSIDLDSKMYIIFNFPDIDLSAPTDMCCKRPRPYQLVIDCRQYILDYSATDIMHTTLSRLNSYINNGYEGDVESV